MDTPALPLAADFPQASEADWLKRVEEVLKGRPFERLVAKTHDGLPIAPLYQRAAGARPLAGRTAAWQIMQRVDHPDAAGANAQALDDLENGATALSLVCAGAASAHGYGIAGGALARVLDSVLLDAGVALELDLPAFDANPARELAAFVKARGIAPAATTIRFGLDPLASAARSGRMPHPWAEQAKVFAGMAGELAAQGFTGPLAAADGRVVHAAGGSETQELAFALASAVAYLRALEAAGIALDDARRMIFFRLAADADQFLTIAKIRALRKLWARIGEACGLAARPAFIATETAWRMMTRRDPHVNLLRTTVAAFAAAIGGADAIIVTPFTAALGLPDAFARRLARNTQLLLLEESNLARVTDPSAGSGAVEALTDALCQRTWTMFQEIERDGGATAVLESGALAEQIAAVRARRQDAIAHRTDVLTGTTEFANLAETPVAVLDVKPSTPPSASSPTTVTFPPLAPRRLAEPFERLRDDSDGMLAKTGARPNVFLAALGTPADFTARVTFAGNFFAAGGIAAVTGEGDKDAIAAAFKTSSAALACICSSDAVYAEAASAAATALKQAGARHIYLAGRPEPASALQDAGVGTFIFAGCDALATLRAAHDIVTRAREIGSNR